MSTETHTDQASTRAEIKDSRVAVVCGHAFFAAYCVFAIVFYRERVIYDASVFLNTGPLLEDTFFKALDRVTVQIPPQLLPLLVVKLGGSSWLAALAYSLNFAVFHYAFWLLLVHGYRRSDLGLAFIVCLLVHLVHNNIFIQADLMHAAGYLFAFLATAESAPQSAIAKQFIRPSCMMLFAFAAFLGHPLMVPLLSFYTVYVMLVARRIDVAVVVSVMFAISLYAINKYAYADFYESGAFEKTLALSHLRNSLAVLPNYLWHAHWPAGAVLAVFLFATLRNTRTVVVAVLAITLIFILGIAVCSWIPLAEHNNWQFSGYTWMYFLPIYLVFLIPIFDLRCSPTAVRPLAHLKAGLCGTIATWAICGTVLDFHLVRERQLFILRVRDALSDVSPPIYLLDAQFSTNSHLRENDLTLWDDSLLVSSYDGPKKACMVISPHAWNGGVGDMYRERYTKPLNPNYFDIPGAKNNAHSANTTVDMPTILLAAKLLELSYPESPIHWTFSGGSPGDYRKPLQAMYSVPVHFKNHGPQPFPSRLQRIAEDADGDGDGEPTPITVGYCWVLNGSVIAEDRNAENLPIDIRGEFVHDVRVRRTGIPKDATLMVGLFAAGIFVPTTTTEEWPAQP